MGYTLGVESENSRRKPKVLEIFFSCFLNKVFRFGLAYFELTFVCGVREGHTSLLLHVGLHLPQRPCKNTNYPLPAQGLVTFVKTK